MDSRSYKAFRIVLLHFIGPCIKAGEKKRSNVIQRWWRRINGYYNYELSVPRRLTLSPPPGLWRQSNGCINNKKMFGKIVCKRVPKRWARKITMGRIKTQHIQKFIKNELAQENHDHFDYALENRFSTNEILEYRKYWIGLTCACNNKPARIIIDYQTRYNKMESIFRELASDNLTYQTRSIVSRFVIDRLKPK